MDYALETIHQLLVRGVAIPAAMIEMMAFWRRLTRTVVALLVAATILEHTIVGGRGR